MLSKLNLVLVRNKTENGCLFIINNIIFGGNDNISAIAPAHTPTGMTVINHCFPTITSGSGSQTFPLIHSIDVSVLI
jgi:hypothetical protein